MPKAAGAKVLISVEKASKVISRHWVNSSGDKETAYKIRVTKDMAPNFYVHAIMLQPHSKTVNDLPIRMYGVQGAEVINRNSILHPEIKVKDNVQPEEEFTIEISEKNNKAMSYTLAIVDEGLLDINSYKTPQIWRGMNQKEALELRTYDMYNDVIGAYNTKFTPVLSIGGDEALRKALASEKRFNPVVKFLGPFTLEGGKKKHKISISNYMGSVRVMVVAAYNGSYGSVDKAVRVSSPLMIYSTFPRVLKSGDEVKVPITIVSEDASDEIQVSMKTEGPVSILGNSNVIMKSTAARNERGENDLAEFEVVCNKNKSGKAKFVFTTRDTIQNIKTIFH